MTEMSAGVPYHETSWIRVQRGKNTLMLQLSQLSVNNLKRLFQVLPIPDIFHAPAHRQVREIIDYRGREAPSIIYLWWDI